MERVKTEGNIDYCRNS